MSADEALTEDARNYARDYGVPLAEAKRRMAIMAEAGDAVAALESELGDDVSGIYFTHDRGFELVARTTGKQKREKRNLKIKDRNKKGAAADLDLPVTFIPDAKVSKKVAKSLIKDNKKSLRSRFEALQGVSYDERSGEIVILLQGDPASQSTFEDDRLDLEKQYKAPVRIEVVPVTLSTMAMRGGAATYLTSGTIWCTTAFAAKDPAGTRGILTAGHCDEAQMWKEGGKNYNLVNRSYFDEWGDWGFLSGHTVVGEFYAEKGATPRKLTGRRTQYNTNERNTSAGVSGSYICYFGRNTGNIEGQQCGEVTSTSFAPSYASPGCSNGPTYVACQPNFIEVRPKGTAKMYCRGGDSGAPWFAYTTAFGIMSGCSSYSDNTAYNLIYTSTDEPYLYGYSLIYP